MGQSQSGLDLDRYLGRWYEVARYPNPFQIDCRSSTADYIKMDQKTVVINTCHRENGSWYQMIGELKPDSKVEFKYRLSRDDGTDVSLPEGEYLVYSTDYDKFSFVGGGEYFWVLSRYEQLIDSDYAQIDQVLYDLGYSPDELIWNY